MQKAPIPSWALTKTSLFKAAPVEQIAERVKQRSAVSTVSTKPLRVSTAPAHNPRTRERTLDPVLEGPKCSPALPPVEATGDVKPAETAKPRSADRHKDKAAHSAKVAQRARERRAKLKESQ